MSITPRVVVIGSGAGGLVAAARLAQKGLDVTVLEQGSHLGGRLAPFERDGFHFDVGLHYVGGAQPGGLLHHVLGKLDLKAEELFVEMEPSGFDVYRFPDFEVRNGKGIDTYRDRLRKLFPSQDYGLIEVFGLVSALHEAAALGARPLHLADAGLLLYLPALLRFGHATLSEVLGTFLTDPRAKAAVAGPCGDYGLPPSKASALVGLSQLAQFADGAFYPRGGSGALRYALTDAGARAGVRYRTGAPVRRILINGGAVAGVELEDGERIEAMAVVSDIDPTVTLRDLLPFEAVPDELRHRAERMKPSLSALVVNLGMKRDLREHGMGAANLWLYPDSDIDRLYEPVLRGEVPEEFMLFVSSGSTKDPSGALAPEGCSTLEIVTAVGTEPFAAWAHLPPGHRGNAYHDRKEAVADRVLMQLEKAMPGLVGDVVVREVSTPLSFIDHLASPGGGLFGPALTPDQSGLSRFGTHTPVHGLVLAGQGTFGAGVAPSLLSGQVAAHAAARYVEHRRG